MTIENAYNSWASQYDSNLNKTRDLDQIATSESLKNYNFNTVIELGCGTGKNTSYLLKKATKIIGLDFSEEMLKKARKKITSNNVIFRKADLTKPWKIDDNFANLITCSLTLEHIQNLDFIFDQANQKMQKDGLFFICELHPFKQYLGSKARFKTKNGIIELTTYTHNITTYIDNAIKNEFKLIALKEWFDDEQNQIPRLISFIFKK